MTTYFEKFPKISYDITGSGRKQTTIDILRRVALRQFSGDAFYVFYPYNIKDGETPEIIASKIYGSSQYHWIVILANNIIDPYYDWPMTDNQLIATIRKKYGVPEMDGLIYAYQTIHHYENADGYVIDEQTFVTIPYSERKAVMVYDWEVSQNEAKRSIRLLDPKYVGQVDKEMGQIIQGPKF